LDKKFEDVSKTKDIMGSLKVFGLEKELLRMDKTKIRSGRGKSRGRKYRIKKGPLIVVSKESNIKKAAGNIPGIDIVDVKKLNVELLAPGHIPGRLTLWTAGALEKMEKEKLFM
jgi:large subunit ribosomal protein L4e